MSTFELIIFILLVLFNTISFFMWFFNKKEHKPGKLYNRGEILTFYTTPRIAFVLYVIFLIFYLANFNKLHLLYICPIVYFVINYRVAKRIVKADKDLQEKNNKTNEK